jgi:hypothetical protein
MSKKLVSAALAGTTLVWALGVAVLPVANAQTASSVQAQIQALLAQIAQLQAQMGTSSTGTTMTSAYNFTQDLTLGSKGADVTALQQMLISDGYLTAVTAPTGYFGALTQKALAAFQAAKGITPAAGYFGPKTRAFVNSMSVSTTPTTPVVTGTTTSGAQTTTGVAAPASGLAVSLASSNPGAGSLISGSSGGAARVPVLSVNLTAGVAGGVTVSAISFHKVGVLSDSSVAGAYLTQNGKVLYQYNSLNQGVLSFSGMSLNVPAGQTVTLTLAIDVSGGLSAGNTVAFSLNAASDVTAFDASNNAVTPSGMYPVSGNTFTVTNVTNPSLATVGVASSSIGNLVTAGTQGNLVGAWNFTVSNNKVYLESLNFHVIGSANKGDIRNVKLMVNGTQVGATLPTVGQDGTAYFDASAAPGVLNTGSNNVQVFADVMGSPSYNFQFEILNGYDVLAVDSQYNVPVSAGANSGSLVDIQQGTITTTQDANTPTGNIAKGQSQITIAKFDIYAAGEAVKVLNLPFSLTFTGVNTASDTQLSQIVQNVAIVDDAGGQVGTTINQPPSADFLSGSSSHIASTGAGASTFSSTNVTYADSFGTSASPINYTVPANTTRVLSLRVDVQSTANFSTVTGAILQGSQNLQGLISSQIGSTSGAQGSALSLAASSLAAAANNALGNQSVSAGVSNLEIGSYALTASSAEGVNVNNLTITMGNSTVLNSSLPAFQNLKVLVNGTQFGVTQGTLGQGGIYTFSGTPFTVPAGNTVDVNVYADTLSSATGTATTATSLTGLSGTGAVSYTSISLASNVPGQTVTFVGNDQMSVAADSSEPAATTLTMGSTGNTLAVYRFQELSNIQPVKITDLTVTDVSTSTATTSLPAFSNLQLYSGSTLLGTAGSAVAGSAQTCTGGYAASSTLTVTLPGAVATSSYSAQVTDANGITLYFPIQLNEGAANTVQEEDEIAAGVAAVLQASSTAQTALNIASSSVATLNPLSGNTIVLTSNGTASMNASVSVFTLGTVTSAVNNVGQAQNCMTNTVNTGTYTYAFHFANPIIVPQANTTLVTLKGDVASYSGGGATDNSVHTFSIATSTAVTALGSTSNGNVNVSGSGSGNPMTVLRSTMTVATSPSSYTQNGKQPLQQIGSITLTANNAGPVMLKSLKLNFSGSNISVATMTPFLSTVVLKGSNSVDVTASSTGSGFGAASSSDNQTYITWTFATSTVNSASTTLVVSPGSPVTLQLWGTTNALVGGQNVSQSLAVTLQNTTDVAYLDATDGTGSQLYLPSNALPLTVTSFSWGQGQ